MIYDEDPLRRRPRESTARRLRHERCVWMARETTKWPSTRWPITKIMSSDGCNGNRVPLEMGPWYDFREFGCHLGNVGLMVRTIDPNMEFSELAMDLDASGTGIGQAIAMLTVLVSADNPRILVVDEPNSFLHPSAVRKLIQIFRDSPHQFKVTTHSPEVIALSKPSTLHSIQWE